MIDKEARAELRIALRRLVTGRMTNDDFDDIYGKYWSSQDGAVASIVEFGWSLYSDASTYRLKGRYAVSPEVRRFASRSILFLYTDQEYEWPKWPEDPVVRFLELLFPLGVALGLVCGVLSWIGNVPEATFTLWVVVPLGLLLLVAWLSLNFRIPQDSAKRMMLMEQFGDYHNCWPFLRHNDLEKAKKTVQFFGPACSTAA
ncbi:MAG: hypothetical protein K8R36_09765 [Planctomycetales bacterium]|nr:hypothetical protein [Planctomycetales bacterium]